MKEKIIPFIIMIVIGVFGGMIYFSRFYYHDPESDITAALNALVGRNERKANEFLDYQSFYGDTDENKAICKALMRDFSYELKSVANHEVDATAVITVGNRDFEQIYGSFVIEAYQMVLSNMYKDKEEKISDEELEEKIKELLIYDLENTEAPRRSEDIVVDMQRVGRSWRISFDEEDYNAVYGGYLLASEEAGDLLGDLSAESFSKIEQRYKRRLDNAEHELRNAVHFVVEELWNGVLGDICSSINAGTDTAGNDSFDIKTGMEKLDGLLREKVQYDTYIDGLPVDKYGTVRNEWKHMSAALEKLVGEIREADPDPMDYDYQADTSAFEASMKKLINIVYGGSGSGEGAEAESGSETDSESETPAEAVTETETDNESAAESESSGENEPEAARSAPAQEDSMELTEEGQESE